MADDTDDTRQCRVLALSVFMGVGSRRKFVQSILSFLPNGIRQLQDRVQVRLSSAAPRLQQISLDKERRICVAAGALASVPWPPEAGVQALACCNGAHTATLFGADPRKVLLCCMSQSSWRCLARLSF